MIGGEAESAERLGRVDQSGFGRPWLGGYRTARRESSLYLSRSAVMDCDSSTLPLEMSKKGPFL